METSKFNFSKMNFAQVGARASAESTAQLIVRPTPGQFTLGRKATLLMGISVGDHVRFIRNPEAENTNEQYFIAKVEKGAPNSSKVNTISKNSKGECPVNFSIASVWSILHQNSVDAVELNLEGMEKLGLVTKTEKSLTGIQTITYDLVAASEEPVEIQGEMVMPYLLTNRTVKTSTEVGEEVEEEENE